MKSVAETDLIKKVFLSATVLAFRKGYCIRLPFYFKQEW